MMMLLLQGAFALPEGIAAGGVVALAYAAIKVAEKAIESRKAKANGGTKGASCMAGDLTPAVREITKQLSHVADANGQTVRLLKVVIEKQERAEAEMGGIAKSQAVLLDRTSRRATDG